MMYVQNFRYRLCNNKRKSIELCACICFTSFFPSLLTYCEFTKTFRFAPFSKGLVPLLLIKLKFYVSMTAYYQQVFSARFYGYN